MTLSNPTFNVLDRNESIHRHMLLEASAGTGKTFAIENIVVRLLIESDENTPILIENILVVTFTKMAARELKERIHANLEKSLDYFKKIMFGADLELNIPDYLLVHVEQGETVMLKAKNAIERALFSFDRAQIFTIHGFCWRMLKNYSMEAGISLDACSREDQTLSHSQLMQVVRDFIRCGIESTCFSPHQLKIIMQRAKKDSEKLQRELLNEINKGLEIESPPSFSELCDQFLQAMDLLKRSFGFEHGKIIDDFMRLAPSYKELCDKSKQIHPEKLVLAQQFAALFDKSEWTDRDFDRLIEDGLFLLEAFDPSQLKVKAKTASSLELHYPNLLQIIRDHLEPVVSLARNSASIFSRLASDCQKFVRHYQEQEEIFGHNELLVQMRKVLDKPQFLKRVRDNYRAAIVDEFQDTDPVQWEIFSILFASPGHDWNGYLNLVGDPKQSIYAFRQADIYTYLKAAERLGPGSLATLDTNFRSHSALIDALNGLFNASFETFSLPKTSQSLAYRSVQAGRKGLSLYCGEDVPLEFWEVKGEGKRKGFVKQAETLILYPAIAKEILRLHEDKGIKFGQFAILIADRHQAKRVANYLKQLDIPVKSQKGTDLSDSGVVDEMRDLLDGVMSYHSKSKLNIALASRLIGMTHHELHALDQESHRLEIVVKFNELKSIWVEEGFAKFYHLLMSSSWHPDGKSVMERLLNQSGGAEFYREFQDLADLIVEEEQARNLLPQAVAAFLDELEELSRNEDDRIKAYVDPDEEGVAILTTHVSKGLEFDFVFALGLIKRGKAMENGLVPLESTEKPILGAVKDKYDPRFLKYCEESDAEKMRQFYVALTRAREKLYIPVVIEENLKEVPFGCASPIDLFVARLDRPHTDYNGIYQRILAEDGSTLAGLASKHAGKLTLVHLARQDNLALSRKKATVPLLFTPMDVSIPEGICVLQSFTSLSHNKNNLSYILEDVFSSEEVVKSAPHDFSSANKSEHTLPSGSETGVLLHKIFELLPFNSVRDLLDHQALRPLIIPFLKGTAFGAWEDVIAKIVFETYKTKFGLHFDFSLADVDPKKIYRETEFLYPCNVGHPMLQETQAQPGFLKGVVDLFFEHERKFYILDWKSNWLGPDKDYYGQNHLTEAMRSNHYDLQAKIYCEAFQRYLKLFDNRPFVEIFGGIYYFFVRGISESTGILHLSIDHLGL